VNSRLHPRPARPRHHRRHYPDHSAPQPDSPRNLRVRCLPSVVRIRFLPYLATCHLRLATSPLSSIFFLFNRFPTLPSSVFCKSFVCRSYENCRGVYQQFPKWNVPAPVGTKPSIRRGCESSPAPSISGTLSGETHRTSLLLLERNSHELAS
jgi:hypothetical protein